MKSIKSMIHKRFVSSFQNFFVNYKWILIFLLLYILLRIIFINVNSAEWGDSYRILRATEFLQNFSYPTDEKRPPLFSFLLLFRFSQISLFNDPILSGRVTMLFLSVFNVLLFYIFCKIILKSSSEKIILFAVGLFAFNPLFVYWSLRIYADNLFLLLMLLSFILYFKFQENRKLYFLIPIPLILILSITTRFEGYLLSLSIISAFFLGFIFSKIKIYPFLFITLFLTFLIFLVSYFKEFTFYINPIFSKYVDEAESRKITIDEINNFIFQLLFLIGSVFGVVFVLNNFVNLKIKNILEKWLNYGPLVHMFLLQFALSFVWFAAVPRLFLPILPILVILFVKGYENFKFGEYSKKLKYFYFFMSFIFLLIYIGSQLYLKLPFLITGLKFFLTNIFVGLVGLGLLGLVLFKKFPKNSMMLYFILSNIVWAILFVSLEKDTYKVLNQAVTYFKQNYSQESIVLSNDVSSISRFYLKDKFRYSRELDYNEKVLEKVAKVNPDYIIVTNEHNPSMSFTASKYPGFVLEKEFREKVNSRVFFTQIIKVNYE